MRFERGAGAAGIIVAGHEDYAYAEFRFGGQLPLRRHREAALAAVAIQKRRHGETQPLDCFGPSALAMTAGNVSPPVSIYRRQLRPLIPLQFRLSPQ